MANKTYNDHPTDNTPAADDLIPYWDVASSAAKKATRAKIVGATITGDGTIATGGYTLTVPATGTAALRNAANTFTRVQAQGFRTEQVTIAPNDVYSFTPPAESGMLLVNSRSGGTPRQHTQALIAYRHESFVAAWCMILTQTSTYVETSTSELTGTTGTMNTVTVSSVQATKKIYIENRTDTEMAINITVFA